MKFGCVLLVLGAAVPVLPCSTLGLDLAHWWQPARPTGCLQQKGTLELRQHRACSPAYCCVCLPPCGITLQPAVCLSKLWGPLTASLAMLG